MAADDLAPCVDRSSSAVVLVMHDRYASVFDEAGLLMSAPSDPVFEKAGLLMSAPSASVFDEAGLIMSAPSAPAFNF